MHQAAHLYGCRQIVVFPACAEPEEDWGAAALAQALYTVSNDVTRVQTLLPELSPADRWLTPIINMGTGRNLLCLSSGVSNVLTDIYIDVPIARCDQSKIDEPVSGALRLQRLTTQDTDRSLDKV